MSQFLIKELNRSFLFFLILLFLDILKYLSKKSLNLSICNACAWLSEDITTEELLKYGIIKLSNMLR